MAAALRSLQVRAGFALALVVLVGTGGKPPTSWWGELAHRGRREPNAIPTRDHATNNVAARMHANWACKV
jgi:hypothetical protein